MAHRLALDTLEKGFAFDIELLLRVELARSGAIAKVPIARIDSELSSTTSELEPYLPMLRSVVRFSRHYLPRELEADRFAALIESLDEVPPAIADGDPARFGGLATVSVDDLRSVLERQSGAGS